MLTPNTPPPTTLTRSAGADVVGAVLRCRTRVAAALRRAANIADLRSEESLTAAVSYESNKDFISE